MKPELENPYVHFALEDNLLIATYKKNVKMDLPIAKEVVRLRLQYTGSRILPVLILDAGIIGINKAARDYLSSEEGTQKIKAAGIVFHSALSAMNANFLVTLNKPNMP